MYSFFLCPYLTVKAPGSSNFESAKRPIDTRRTTSSEASFQKIWALESKDSNQYYEWYNCKIKIFMTKHKILLVDDEEN
jgi:hypothetical protein